MTLRISPLERVYNIIEEYLQQELVPDGLLSDVNTFLTSADTKDHIDPPLIWIEKEEITPHAYSSGDQEYLDVKVSIVCCDEVVEDIRSAENSSLNLASRCLTSIQKNTIQKSQVVVG